MNNHLNRKLESIVLFLIFLLLSTAFFFLSAEAEVTDVRVENPPSDLALIWESRKLVAKYGNEVWPGFGDNPAPILLRSGDYDYLLGHPDPPEGFVRVKDKPNLSIKKSKQPSPELTIKQLGGIWSVSIPVREKLIDRKRKDAKNLHPKFSKTEYLRRLIKESFNAYRMRSLGGPETLPHIYSLETGPEIKNGPVYTENWKNSMLKIGNLLAQSLRSGDLKSVRELADRALAIQKKARRSLNSKINSFEIQIQWLEGVSYYAAVKTLMEAHEKESILEGEIKPPSPQKIRSDLIAQLTIPLGGPSSILKRLTATGAIKGMILDRIYPGWKKVFFRKIRPLYKLLEVGVSVPEPLENFPVTHLKLNGRELKVALADDPARRARGLKHVTEIKPLDGMVFIFSGEVRTGFWMKDTEIPLQIGFFDSKGFLIDSTILQPCSSYTYDIYTPDKYFYYVIELLTD